ncbi:MAG: AAA family ATPase, partial [Dysgonamonadaceae bacterium]|nr:AAA family ATPase [Dysgonamonadaceae bacterium]
NHFIDEFVYEDENNPVDYHSSLKKLFRTMAFEFTVCDDLKIPPKEAEFFQNSRKQFNHIQQTVKELFPEVGINKDKLILEPSFVSNALGLQGRLDIMSVDYSSFIELKSGKAIEDFRSGGQFIQSTVNHYTQMILYLAVLEFNLDLNPENIASYLLYSKYPVLSKEKHSRKQLYEALSLRNRIVLFEYIIQKENDIDVTRTILEKINSHHLNKEQLSNKLFSDYLAPRIDAFPKAYFQLNDSEKTYFLRLYTFIVKELWLSKVGEREYEGIKKAAVLWNASFEDKLIAGEILYDLSIEENKASDEEHIIRLKIPVYEDLYLPNFRLGDSIVLYERNKDSDNVNNHQVFKGSIELLEVDSITIRLRYRQKNQFVWNPDSCYAIEHDYMDSTYNGMFRALFAFLNANQDRRDLLLGKRLPDASECFLLVGPPGTGKTSIALKNKVMENLLEEKSNILLLSYTNRAVDEICQTLVKIQPEVSFIRIGNELSCAPEFREYLLENRLKKEAVNRKDVSNTIGNCRLFTGTAASVWNKQELFKLKQFDLCIVDEATQLLEPHLLGFLCSKIHSGENAIKRFVLIGDHKQLPAVILQNKEESKVTEPELNQMGITNLKDSLFERWYKKYSEKEHFSVLETLSKQGRMHPDIAAFPSLHFYGGILSDVGLPHQREEWKENKRLLFHQILPSGNDLSAKVNINEAKEVVNICLDLYRKETADNKPFNPEEIGIITPFRNQIALIRKELQNTNIPAFGRITIDTVERYQGSQRDIIIYSFSVKTQSQLEALPNWMEENGKQIDRKLNVALTRAKKQLHIVGNTFLLSQNELYNQLIQYIELL